MAAGGVDDSLGRWSRTGSCSGEALARIQGRVVLDLTNRRKKDLKARQRRARLQRHRRVRMRAATEKARRGEEAESWRVPSVRLLL